jgi:alkylmercury lyase
MTLRKPTDLDALDAALAGATPTLVGDGCRLAVAVYRLLARGAPVGLAEAANDASLPRERAEQLVASWPAVFFDEEERIVGFWGLALQAMTHRLVCAGVELSSWCAWDPLFLARIVGDMEVRTHDPVTEDLITYRVTQDGTITGLSYPSTVMSFLCPDRPWDDEIMTRFCHFVWHFTGVESAERWTAKHPGTFTLGLDQATELARRHVARST